LSTFQIRDISHIKLSDTTALIIACDSSGGIGNKPGDSIRVPEDFLGRFTLRVPLLEVLATGAKVLSIINTLSVEMHPSGELILQGIIAEARHAGLDPASIINGSTEDNIPVQQTGLGVTVIGLVVNAAFRPGTSQKDDIIVCFGQPYVGEEVGQLGMEHPGFANVPLLDQLLATQGVHDILPVGSKGILHEIQELCQAANKNFSLRGKLSLDLSKSAGPATCLIASMQEQSLQKLTGSVLQEISILADII